MSTPDNNNLSLDDLKAVVHKCKEEARRDGYTDGAYDAIMAFCRAIGIPGLHVSRPSLWAVPIDRVRSLEEYTDEYGIEALEELRGIIGEHVEGVQEFSVDALFDNEKPLDVSPMLMPQSQLDIDAIEQQEDRQNG